jgi:hypothetical protein
MRVVFLSMLLFAAGAGAEPDAKLLADLRQGGYVLFLRHASTDFTQNDSRMTSFEDCATQRNLTDNGRAEARALGEHIRRLKIPIGEVLASPFCRTMETARLAFGRARATNDVRGGPLSADDPKRYEPLRKLLGTRPRAGTNTVLSSHGNPFRAVAGPPYLAEGEIAVVRPQGGENFSVIARIRLADW